MSADELARWVAAGSALIAFLVALRMQVIEPLIRAMRESREPLVAALVANTEATDVSAKAMTTTAVAVDQNTVATNQVAAALPASPTTVNVTNVPQPLPGGEFLPTR